MLETSPVSHPRIQKKVEDELRRTEQQLRLIVETIPGFVWCAGPGGGNEYVNQRLLDYTGATAEDFKGDGWARFLHPDDLQRTNEVWARTLATGANHYETSYRMRRADGAYQWFQVVAQLLRDECGQPLRWYGLDLCIDAQKQAEEALRQKENDLRLTIETLPAFVWRAGPQGEIDYINRRIAAYTGSSLEEFVASGWAGVVHPEDIEMTESIRTAAIRHGHCHETVHRVRRVDGTYRWFKVLVQPLKDEYGRVVHWYGIHLDIDESQKTEEALRLTQAQLSRALQFATVAELAAAVAHEVTQPLFGVTMNLQACLEWLAAGNLNPDKARKAAELAIEDASDAARVVQKVRALFRKSAPVKESLNLRGVIEEVLRLMQDEMTRGGATVELTEQAFLPPILGDRLQMQQVLWNLLHNAMDAMDHLEKGSKAIHIDVRAEKGSGIVVSIGDRGIGVPDPEKVFEAFFTTKDKGMGMGLSICKSIVEAHGGRLWARLNVGPGTTFSFSIPTVTTEPI
jgi:PAS domain S-box-containing protein